MWQKRKFIWQKRIGDIGDFPSMTRMIFKIAPVDQKAGYSVQVLANHNRQLDRGGWIAFYVATSDADKGYFRFRRDDKLPPSTNRGLKAELFVDKGDVRLIVQNDWVGNLFALTIVVEGKAAILHEIVAEVKQESLRLPIVASFRQPCSQWKNQEGGQPNTCDARDKVNLPVANIIDGSTDPAKFGPMREALKKSRNRLLAPVAFTELHRDKRGPEISEDWIAELKKHAGNRHYHERDGIGIDELGNPNRGKNRTQEWAIAIQETRKSLPLATILIWVAGIATGPGEDDIWAEWLGQSEYRELLSTLFEHSTYFVAELYHNGNSKIRECLDGYVTNFGDDRVLEKVLVGISCSPAFPHLPGQRLESILAEPLVRKCAGLAIYQPRDARPAVLDALNLQIVNAFPKTASLEP